MKARIHSRPYHKIFIHSSYTSCIVYMSMSIYIYIYMIPCIIRTHTHLHPKEQQQKSTSLFCFVRCSRDSNGNSAVLPRQIATFQLAIEEFGLLVCVLAAFEFIPLALSTFIHCVNR